MGQFSDVSTIVLWRPALQRLRSVDGRRRASGVRHIAVIGLFGEVLCGRPVLNVLLTFARQPAWAPQPIAPE
jgi:hypothetical protein